MSSFLMFCAGIITTVCVLKLVACGLKLRVFSYSEIVLRILGRRAKLISDVMIAATQFSFTISHVTFEVDSLKSTVDAIWGINTSKSLYAIAILCMLIPIAWVRDIGKFSFTFMLGNFLIMFTVMVVSVYCIGILSNEGPGPDLVVWNR